MDDVELTSSILTGSTPSGPGWRSTTSGLGLLVGYPARTRSTSSRSTRASCATSTGPGQVGDRLRRGSAVPGHRFDDGGRGGGTAAQLEEILGLGCDVGTGLLLRPTVTAAAFGRSECERQLAEDVDVVGVSMYNGADLTLAPAVVDAAARVRLGDAGRRGGIVTPADVAVLLARRVVAVLGSGASTRRSGDRAHAAATSADGAAVVAARPRGVPRGGAARPRASRRRSQVALHETGAPGSALTARMVPAARTPTMWLNFPLRPDGDISGVHGAAGDADLAGPGRPTPGPSPCGWRPARRPAGRRAGSAARTPRAAPPRPRRSRASARASVSTSSSRWSDSTRTRPRVPPAARTVAVAWPRSGGGRTPGRTVTICVGLRQVMSATSAPAKAGWPPPACRRHRSPMASPTRPEPVAAATRPATSRPKTVLGASTAHGAVLAT